jgi:hypothetical protein
MRNSLYIIVLFLIAGCSSSKVVYDYDAKTDFSKYTTYHFFDDVGEGLNELDVKRFTRSIENVLDSLQIQKSEQPSFFINVISEKSDAVGDDVGVGIGGGGRNIGIGISTGISFGGNKINERITLEFVDSASNTLFWEGVINVKVREKIKPEDRVVLVDKIIRKILSKYPPKG